MIFNVEIAGTVAEITAGYPENRSFLKDYIVEGRAEISVSPSKADCLQMEAALKKELEKEVIPAWFVENNVIHKLLAETLVDHDVLLMHGSAVVMDGETYIFMADSGTGKSTHTRLWMEQFKGRAWMLNDDKPMLKVTDEGVTAYGTPWNGKEHLGCNASAPVRAIIMLMRGADNHIEPMKSADAVSYIFRHALRPQDPAKLKMVLEMETKIAEKCGFYRLRCNMDPEAAIVAYEGIRRCNETEK